MKNEKWTYHELENKIKILTNELLLVNKEMFFQNEEKVKRANELIIANKELIYQKKEKAKRAAELIIANKELFFQNSEKAKRKAELLIANILKEDTEKWTAELLVAKEKAQESERLKSAFLSNMSHEIRTPLNIIIGYSEFLAENNLTKPERTEYITMITTNSIRLFSHIDNILDFSKIEAGQKLVKLKTFNINDLIDELYKQNINTVEKKQLALYSYKELKNEQALIHSSEQFIYQIYTNLLNNALKYTLSGKIDYGYNIKDNEIELFVSDSGIGISKEYISNLFKRFSQENSALSRTYEGVGLGLSIVKGNVELLNGTITVNSEKGTGTSFKITIPINKIVEESEKTDTNIVLKEIQNNKKITILIVEDDEASFFLLQRQILREFTCDIIHAINGFEAIEKVNMHSEITCILMDMHLPIMDGCETTKRIKKTKRNLPIFAVTAAVMDIDKEKAFNAGCDNFFSKPIDRVKLYDLILKLAKDKK